jgi:NAD(P)-dependent dehydrogenase (short-subunit alcohol dehydrogenase family)
MTSNPQRHPFLDDLADDVELVSSILYLPVRGREAVLEVVKAGARQYASQTPRSLDHAGGALYFEYDFTLKNGVRGVGLVSIRRASGGKVTALNIAFSPLDAVTALADAVRAELGELDTLDG